MVVGWLIIGILVVIFLLIIFKSQDVIFLSALFKKYFFFIVVMGLVLFFVFSIYHVSKSYPEADFTTFKGIIGAGKVYLLWMKDVFVNLGDITGYAVKQDWLVNATNSTGR